MANLLENRIRAALQKNLAAINFIPPEFLTRQFCKQLVIEFPKIFTLGKPAGYYVPDEFQENWHDITEDERIEFDALNGDINKACRLPKNYSVDARALKAKLFSTCLDAVVFITLKTQIQKNPFYIFEFPSLWDIPAEFLNTAISTYPAILGELVEYTGFRLTAQNTQPFEKDGLSIQYLGGPKRYYDEIDKSIFMTAVKQNTLALYYVPDQIAKECIASITDTKDQP